MTPCKGEKPQPGLWGFVEAAVTAFKCHSSSDGFLGLTRNCHTPIWCVRIYTVSGLCSIAWLSFTAGLWTLIPTPHGAEGWENAQWTDGGDQLVFRILSVSSPVSQISPAQSFYVAMKRSCKLLAFLHSFLKEQRASMITSFPSHCVNLQARTDRDTYQEDSTGWPVFRF